MNADWKFGVKLFLTIVCVILIVDEAWMLIPGFGYPGWLIGDWSWMHIDPFHHWMLGAFGLLVLWVLWPMFLEGDK